MFSMDNNYNLKKSFATTGQFGLEGKQEVKVLKSVGC